MGQISEPECQAQALQQWARTPAYCQGIVLQITGVCSTPTSLLSESDH